MENLIPQNEIGNVIVVGHSGSGKTSVIEAMAYRAGMTNRIGTVQDGNTLSDYSLLKKSKDKPQLDYLYAH